VVSTIFFADFFDFLQLLISGKRWKRHQNLPTNSDTKPAQTIPLERTARLPRSVTQNRHAPTAGSRCSISPKVSTVVELVVPILKDVTDFHPIHSFSARRQNADFGH